MAAFPIAININPIMLCFVVMSWENLADENIRVEMVRSDVMFIFTLYFSNVK